MIVFFIGQILAISFYFWYTQMNELLISLIVEKVFFPLALEKCRYQKLVYYVTLEKFWKNIQIIINWNSESFPFCLALSKVLDKLSWFYILTNLEKISAWWKLFKIGLVALKVSVMKVIIILWSNSFGFSYIAHMFIRIHLGDKTTQKILWQFLVCMKSSSLVADISFCRFSMEAGIPSLQCTNPSIQPYLPVKSESFHSVSIQEWFA